MKADAQYLPGPGVASWEGWRLTMREGSARDPLSGQTGRRETTVRKVMRGYIQSASVDGFGSHTGACGRFDRGTS